MRTLVVAPNWVGDAVMALPTLEALAGSGRQLVVLAKPHLHPLLRLSSAVGELVERDRDDAVTIERLRGLDCAESVSLTASVSSVWLPYRAGIRYRWGYAGTLRASALWRPPFPHVGRFLGWSLTAGVRTALLRPAVPHPRNAKRPQVEDHRELLAAMEVAPPSSWVPRLPIDAALAERGRQLLARAQTPVEQGPIVGVFPGAEFGPSKRWPWQRFAELAIELRRAIPGVRVVIVAGPQELWLAVRVHEESGKLHPVVGPDLDLGALAGVLSHLDLLVTNDSGPMHVAAAVGVPCVALFGPTDARRTAPAGVGHRVLDLHRWCAPCLRRRCPLLHQRCLRDVGVQAVLAAAEATLAAHRRTLPIAP